MYNKFFTGIKYSSDDIKKHLGGVEIYAVGKYDV